jgi:hypothetical protein
MDENKKKYLAFVVSYFSKLYDSRYFGVLENVKIQDGMVVHIEKTLKSESIPRFDRKTA